MKPPEYNIRAVTNGGSFMPADQKVLDILTTMNALITRSHVRLPNGYHATDYIDMDSVYPHTAELKKLCRMMAMAFKVDGIEAVIGPANGAVALSQHTAAALTGQMGYSVLSLFADKELVPGQPPRFFLRPAYKKLVTGRKFLVVEDILVTGFSIRQVVQLIENHGGEVAGVSCIWNREELRRDSLGVGKLNCLVNQRLDSWENEQACPHCRAGLPLAADLFGNKELANRNLTVAQGRRTGT